MRPSRCIFFLSLMSMCSFLLGQNGQGGSRQSQPSDRPTAPSVFKVVINPSRVSVTRDGGYGVYADIQNISGQPALIKASETALVIYPEVSQPNACVERLSAIFPTVIGADIHGVPNAEVTILPGEDYRAFWGLTGNETQSPDCKPGVRLPAVFRWLEAPINNWTRYLGFYPGEYTFTIEGLAHMKDDKTQADIVHTYAESTTMKVTLSQTATAIAAFIGGLLAYLFVAVQPNGPWDQFVSKTQPTGDSHKRTFWIAGFGLARDFFAAGLVGAAVTVVSSRLADTQFPVKVSVGDVWGALTIGFVSYFIGTRFIVKLLSPLAASSK